MTREEALEFIAQSVKSDVDMAKVADALKALEQEPRKITFEDVKGYCEPRCLTIVSNELYYELTHPKIKALEQEPILDKIRAEIDKIYEREGSSFDCLNALDELKEFIDKCKAESEE